MTDAPFCPPGSTREDALSEDLIAALKARGSNYKPRTKHRSGHTPQFVNRLILESSPYLLQHAHNPVDWYPWGDEAFARAQAEDRPIFLSVGYATCHWCHVMEEESFEDLEIGEVVNRLFVPVKVDRETRPDVDSLYMTAVQAITGRGGWPMSVFLTPDGRPFFAGTYFPARDGDRGELRGFLSLVVGVWDAWKKKRDSIETDAKVITDGLRKELGPQPDADVPSADLKDVLIGQVIDRFDHDDGGLKVQTKFPSQVPMRLLINESHHDERAATMLHLTLSKMARGGVYDQLEGGFHRYSTDPEWLVPHFEKMLYDNAQLSRVYVDAWATSGNGAYKRTAEETLDYLQNRMRNDDGAFYSATDADALAPDGSHLEGISFTWTPQELLAELGPEGLEQFARIYGVNVRGDHDGRSVLRVVAEPADDERELLDTRRRALLVARDERPQPLTDDKIVTAWNALAITAFARAALVFDDDGRLEVAERCANFIYDNARDDKWRLARVVGDRARVPRGLLDDHAFLCQAMLDLFEASADIVWLDRARALDDELAARFEDEAGAWFKTPDDHEALLVREKSAHDGAEPAGGSVHTLNLLRLHAITAEDGYRARATKALRSVSTFLKRAPLAGMEWIYALDAFHRPSSSIVLAGEGVRKSALMDVARRAILPGGALLAADEVSTLNLPLTKGRDAHTPTAWVCRDFLCSLPSSSAEELRNRVMARNTT